MKQLIKFDLLFWHYKSYHKIIVVIVLLILLSSSLSAQDNRIPLLSGKRIFSSGMNMAWGDFARDAIDLPEATFIQALDDISSNGGNSMRWWVHVNGRYSPVFTDGKVSGITTEIENIRRILDLAYERQMVICLSLWSHDMLRDQEQNLDDIVNMLEDSASAHAYVENALIPMVRGLKGHPAILCWEIFNEPEGMLAGGWTDRTTTYPAIQRFVNICTGAIHREDPDALVTNGTHRISYVSAIGSFHNNYADSVLIAAGGDSLGTLDFYQVHYYADFPADQNPFSYSYSHWELDKPLVIGEFSANGPNPSTTPLQAYQLLYYNGYAGAWSWTWTGHDGNGDVTDAAPGMLYLRNNFPDDIIVSNPGVILSFEAVPAEIIVGDSAMVMWSTSDGSQVMFNDSLVAQNDSLTVFPDSTTTYTLIASSDLFADTSQITLEVWYTGKIISFTANPEFVNVGETSLLKWNSVPGSSLTLDGETVNENDSLTVYPQVTTTYTLIGSGVINDTATVTINVVMTGFTDDFENGILDGWVVDHPTTYGLSEAGGVLTIDYHRTASSWEWDQFNFTPPAYIDASANPVIRLKVKSTVTTVLTLKPIYEVGDDWLQRNIPGTDTWQSYTFNMTSLASTPMSKIYFYLDGGTTTEKSGTVQFDDFKIGDHATAIDDKEKVTLSFTYTLGDAYPNPFNPSTSIEFTINKTERVNLTVFNITGSKVKSLVDGTVKAGITVLKWDGMDEDGNTVSSGVYFYRLQTVSGFTQTKKMILMK